MTPSSVRSVRGRAPVTVAGACLAALAADVAFDPQHRHVPLCPFHAATGWWCPFCGGLRAANALAHLQWRAAVHDNVLFVAALPVLALVWMAWFVRGVSGQPPRRVPRAVPIVIVAVLAAFCIVRNLPFAAAIRPL